MSFRVIQYQIIPKLALVTVNKKMHEDEELDGCDKFQYLLQSVKTSTPARDLVESYLIISKIIQKF